MITMLHIGFPREYYSRPSKFTLNSLYSPHNTNEAAEIDLEASPEGLVIFDGSDLSPYESPAQNCVSKVIPNSQNIIPIPPPRNLSSKSPIRKLDFDHEIQIHSKGAVLEINKVRGKELPKIFPPGIELKDKIGEQKIQGDTAIGSTQENQEEAENKKIPFYPLRTSPMQMFNSFSPNASYLSQTINQKYGRGSLAYSESKFVAKRICCNCKKSHCLKLYCECFVNKTFCSGCNCISCLNTEENKNIRDKAMISTLERNPVAFDPKIAREFNSVSITYLIFS